MSVQIEVPMGDNIFKRVSITVLCERCGNQLDYYANEVDWDPHYNEIRVNHTCEGD